MSFVNGYLDLTSVRACLCSVCVLFERLCRPIMALYKFYLYVFVFVFVLCVGVCECLYFILILPKGE